MTSEVKAKFSLRQFWFYCWGTIVRPASTFEHLAERKALSYSFLAMVAWGVLYSLFAFILYLDGNIPVSLWVAIPAERFYLWEAAYLTPLVLLLWVLFSALAHLLLRFQGFEGEFEAVLGVMGFVWAVPFTLLFLVPDVVFYMLLGAEAMESLVPLYGPASFIWVLFLAGVGLRSVYGVRMWRGILTGAVSFVIHSPLGILLIR